MGTHKSDVKWRNLTMYKLRVYQRGAAQSVFATAFDIILDLYRAGCEHVKSYNEARTDRIYCIIIYGMRVRHV